MGANGGGNQFAGIEHVKDVNRLITVGTTDGAAPWVSGIAWNAVTEKYEEGMIDGTAGGSYSLSYRDNPSALKYLYNYGLTQMGGNPFEGVSAFDPVAELDFVRIAYDAFMEKVNALAPLDDWGTYLTNALGDDILSTIDIDAMFTASMAEAVTEAATAIAAAYTDAADSGTLLTTASTAGGTITALAAAVGDTEAEDTLGKASSSAVSLLSDMETVVSTETEDLVDNASDKAIELLPEMEAIVSTETEDIVTNAIALAEDAVSDVVVTSLTTAYESRALNTHLRAVNRFAGGMADINSVNSSAFVIGMSMKESEFSRDVNDFQAKIEATLYEKGFDGFISTASEVIKAYKDISSSYLATSAKAMDVYSNLVNVFSGIARDYLGYYTEVMKMRIGLYLERAKTEGQVFRDLALEHIGTTVKAGEFIYKGATNIREDITREIDSERASAVLLAEIKRMRIATLREQDQEDLEYDTRYATWDLELFQAVGNITSTMSGAVIPTASRPSKVQSTMGGAMSGAAAGVEIGTAIAPGAGSAIGAGIGTVVGAVAGAYGHE